MSDEIVPEFNSWLEELLNGEDRIFTSRWVRPR